MRVRSNHITDSGHALEAVPAGIVVISSTGVVVSDNVLSGVLPHPAWRLRLGHWSRKPRLDDLRHRLFKLATSGGADGMEAL